MHKKSLTRATAIIIAALIALTMLHCPRASALNQPVTRTFISSKDTYIYLASPTTNFDPKDFIAAGHSGYSDKPIRALIYFGISGIPSYAEIVSAHIVLTLKFIDRFEKDSQIFWVMRMKRYWSETGATWYKATSTTSWSSAGGDYAVDGPKIYGSYGYFRVYKTDPPGKKYSIGVTELVRKYVNEGVPNYGVILVSSTYNGTAAFYDGEDPDTTRRPRLIVVYKLPRIILTATSYTASTSQGGSASYSLRADYQAVNEGTAKIEVVQPFPSGVLLTAQTTSKTNEKWSFKLTAHVSPSIPPGVYYAKVKVTAKSKYGDKLFSSPTITLRLAVTAAGSFTLEPNPSSISIEAGGNATITLRTQPTGGFNGNISLSVADKPQGFTVQLSNQSVAPGGAVQVNISVAPTVSPGTYSVAIEGKAWSLKQQASITVTVTKPHLDYRLSASPQSLTLGAGETGSVQVRIEAVSGGGEDVRLSLHGLPGDASYSFSSNPASPGDTVTLSITAGPTAGNFTVVVKGEGVDSHVERTAILHVNLKGEEKLDFSLAAQPQVLEINQGETGSVQIRVDKLKGKGSIELSVAGVPPGATATITPSTLSPPGYATLMVNAGSAKGTYTLLVQAKSGDTVKTAAVTLKVNEKRCIVATATYGSELSPEVSFLRRFRDTRVLATYSGVRFYAAFDAFYYSWSPAVAQFMHENPWTISPMKVALYPLILSLHAAYAASQPLLDVNAEAGVYLAGFLSAAAIGAVYMTPLAAAALLLARRLGRGFDPARAARVLAATLPAFLLASAAFAALRLDTALTASTSGFVLATAAASSLAVLALLRWTAPRVRGIIERRVF